MLAEHGDHAHLIELVGDLQFSGFEAVARLIGDLEDPLCVVLDFTKVDDLSRVTIASLHRLARAMSEAGIALAVVDADGLLAEHVEAMGIRSFAYRYAALSWAEDIVLRRYGDESCFYDPEYTHAPMLGLPRGAASGGHPRPPGEAEVSQGRSDQGHRRRLRRDPLHAGRRGLHVQRRW